jgi:hypothetical protein
MHPASPPHVSLHTAPTSHWKVHPPPAHELAQVEAALQSNVHPPPAHEPWHDAPDRHWT